MMSLDNGGNRIKIGISLFFVAVLSIQGYRLVIDERYHTQAVAFNEQGKFFSEQRRYDEAIESYQQAIKIKVDYAEAFNNLANA